MGAIQVLQLGTEDFSKSLQVADCAEWCYEPEFSELPERDFDVAILDREVTESEFEYLVRFVRAYCLFVTETVFIDGENVTRQLFLRKWERYFLMEAVGTFFESRFAQLFFGFLWGKV